MLARLTFFGVGAFWVIMNVLLWQLEYGVRGGDTEVPPALVWRKILTAPDASSLSIFQKDQRTGYCEISTGVGQQMATFDESRPPSEGLLPMLDYQLHLAGNFSLGDFTNRIKFEGRLRFNHFRKWKDFSFRITTHGAVIEVASLATNQTVHFKISSDGTALLERNLTFAELEDPGAAIRLLGGNALGDFWGALNPMEHLSAGKSQGLEWDAWRTRVKIGSEFVPIYRMQTTLLGHQLVLDVSPVGEILRIDLPDDICVRIDEWNKP